QRFVHGQRGRAVTRDAFAITQRIQECAAEHDAEIFGRVMAIDFHVTFGRHGQIEQTMAWQLLEHVRKEWDRRFDPRLAGSIEVYLDGDLSFMGVPNTLADAHDGYTC